MNLQRESVKTFWVLSFLGGERGGDARGRALIYLCYSHRNPKSNLNGKELLLGALSRKYGILRQLSDMIVKV